MSKVLVDSSIFLDYYLDRKDNLLPLGEFAFQFFKATASCKYFVLICDLTLKEVGRASGLDEMLLDKKVFRILREKQKLLVVDYSDELVLKARKIASERSLPLNDCVFALIAKENDAVVVSRDKHFLDLADIIECFKPEELQ